MDLTNIATGVTMNFKEIEHTDTMCSRLYDLQQLGSYCDVTLHMKDQTCLAHRCVLASNSAYFDNLLKEKSTEMEHVNINISHQEAFQRVIEYMYIGKINLNQSIVVEVLRLSTVFVVPKLKSHCADFLERSMHPGNCYFVKETAKRWELPVLAKTAHAFLLANITQVVEEKEVLAFDEKQFDNFLGNRCFPMTEDVRFHVLCNWINADISGRHKAFDKLMKHVQWTRLNVHNLYNQVQADKLFAESDWCMYRILKMLDERDLLLPIYRESLKYLQDKITIQRNVEALLEKHEADQAKQREEAKRAEECIQLDASATLDEITDLSTNIQDNLDTEESTKLSKMLINDDDDDGDTDEIGTNDSFLELENLSLQVGRPNQENEETLLGDNTNTVCVKSESLTTIPKIESDDPESSVSHLSANENTDSNVIVIAPEKGSAKNKRKGQPVKLHIQKSRLGYHTEKKEAAKKRGRPPKGIRSLDDNETDSTQRRKPKNKFLSGEIRATEDGVITLNRGKVIVDVDSGDDDLPVKKQKRKYKPREPGGSPKKMPEKTKTQKCEHCEFTCESEGEMALHMESTHADSVAHVCSFCGYTTAWSRQYHKHMLTHFNGPPFKCDHEGCENEFDRIQPLLYHRMRHTDERPFACIMCDLRFRTKNNLQTHMRSHTGEKPWECEFCGRAFATKGTLEQHSVTHSEVRPYLCDTCGFSTKYQSHLIAHKRIHTGDVFRCQVNDCNYSTPKRSQLACHMRSHMSIRQYICAVCSRAFVEKSHLVRHERIHLDDKPFKCTSCDYGSTRRDKLKEHVEKYHSGTTPPKMTYRARKTRRANNTDCHLYADSVHFNQNPEKAREFNEKMEMAVQEKIKNTPIIRQSQLTDQTTVNMLNNHVITGTKQPGQFVDLSSSNSSKADAHFIGGSVGMIDLKTNLLQGSADGVNCGDVNSSSGSSGLQNLLLSRLATTADSSVTSTHTVFPSPQITTTSQSLPQTPLTSPEINHTSVALTNTGNTNILPITLDANSQNLLMTNPLAALALDPRLLQTQNMAVFGAGVGEGDAASVLQGLQVAPVSIAPQGVPVTAADLSQLSIMGIFPNL